MLPTIDNSSQDKHIGALNDKIARFNKAKELTQSKKELLQLLNEINHMHMAIKKLYLDKKLRLDSDTCSSISNFPGVGYELQELELLNVQGVAAENIFTKELKGALRLPTAQQWGRIKNQHTKSVLGDLTRIDDLLSRMTSPPSEQQANELLYALKNFKNIILDKLSYELTNDTDRKYFTLLLQAVNNEIETISPLIPSEMKRNDQIEKVAKTSLIKELSKLDSDAMDELTLMLKNQNAINPGPPTKEDISTILPCIGTYDIKKLGGTNNTNWKISDPEIGIDLIIQIGEPSPNQKLIEGLEHSSVNEYLATPFFTSLHTDESPFNLVVTELYTGGDLRHEREEKQDATPEDILNNATSRIQDLTSFCQSSLQNHSLHPDIKLTNFLINGEGNVVITDKKTFTAIDEAGNVPIREIATTREYAPPEMKNEALKKLNAEAFMCYQLGLALYDYILLPEEPKDTTEKCWSEEIPLKFTNPIFNTEKGTCLKNLITRMLDPNPLERPSLNEVQTQLQQIDPKSPKPVVAEKGVHHKIFTAYKHRTRNAESGREHRIELSGNNFQKLKERYKAFKGDALKTFILDDIKSKIEKTSSLEDLKKLKANFENSDEFKVLNTAQGETTKILQKIGKNTSSINALNEMFKEQENFLKANELRCK